MRSLRCRSNSADWISTPTLNAGMPERANQGRAGDSTLKGVNLLLFKASRGPPGRSICKTIQARRWDGSICQRNYPTQAKRRLEWDTQPKLSTETVTETLSNQRLSEFGKASNDGRRVIASCRGSGVSCHGPCDRGSLVPRVWDHLMNERCAGALGQRVFRGKLVTASVPRYSN